MSSQEVLEGKITQVLDREPHTTTKGKETTRQLIVLSKGGMAIKIYCYGMDDMDRYRGVNVKISGLSESFKKDGSYMANYQTEFADRVESDPTDEHNINDNDLIASDSLETHYKVKDNITPGGTPIHKGSNTIILQDKEELSQFTVTVTRSKDYQSIALTEEFVGSFSEIDSYWADLNRKALILLGKMPKL
ncbi:hypothetical protein LCGC14_0547890 [marine sediment metagenome]|uniref:Uncharacterized protein n=1 Tax=marine sediment metagenome TaxID=412755 RepID=A0A0F9S9F3_9ZZZZ